MTLIAPFYRYLILKNTIALKIGSGSFKVIESDTI